MKFFCIGSREIVLAFRLVGIDGIYAETRDEALDAFNRLVGNGGAVNVPTGELPRVLILTEEVAAMIEKEEIEWQKTGRFPLIVEVPGIQGHLEGKKTLSEAIREAVGVQV